MISSAIFGGPGTHIDQIDIRSTLEKQLNHPFSAVFSGQVQSGVSGLFENFVQTRIVLEQYLYDPYVAFFGGKHHWGHTGEVGGVDLTSESKQRRDILLLALGITVISPDCIHQRCVS